MRISVFDSTHLQGTILALKGMDRELAAQTRKAVRSVSEVEWRADLARQADTLLERRVLVETARVSVTNQNVTLKAGQVTKRLASGTPRSELTPAVEFGANPARRVRSTSRAGTSYGRRVGSGFKARKTTGHVVYPAAAQIIPRIAALFVATTVRTFNEAIEKGAR